MAIKGKSKPKARRSVTPGPRPVYVPVKRPLVQRRGFQIGVVAVLAVAVLGAIAYGFVHERNQNREAAQQALLKRIASAYSAEAQTAISAVGSAQAVSFTLLPDLKTQIDGLRSGDAKPADVATSAKTMQQQASGAADDVAAIDPASMIRGKGVENRVFVDDLIDASLKMENGLRMDAVAAGILQQAASASPAERKALLEQAESARTTAETVFQSGYANWVDAQVAAGTYQPASIGGFGSGANLPAGS
jgi:hypothetical protein